MRCLSPWGPSHSQVLAVAFVHLPSKLGRDVPRDATFDYLVARHSFHFPLMEESSYLLLMVRVHFFYQYGDTFLQLLVFWYKELKVTR